MLDDDQDLAGAVASIKISGREGSASVRERPTGVKCFQGFKYNWYYKYHLSHKRTRPVFTPHVN